MRIFACILSVCCLVGTARAGSLTFNINPGVGSISYAGNGDPLVGTGIAIRDLVGVGPLHNGKIIPLGDATLAFLTGKVGSVGPDGFLFEDGGEIRISSGDPSRPYLEGQLLGNTFVEETGDSINLMTGIILAIPRRDVASYYGLDHDGSFGTIRLSFAGDISGDSFASTRIRGGRITLNIAVPEPPSLLLAGVGCSLLLAFLLRRGI